ncbi:bifunctional NUDIX hydrolase/phosphatase PAP2 family protein [Vibrio vulnificus]|uniref:bifunctional NUDIX hydrolase/phosphatase PAP2 family protein n=1 Tax=Vibrio vulnificus TaxID=672 RepID=UPI000506DB0B|nr:NUDIX domain-containing protein [Vibrio vulnificus]KFK54801.1 DNA mismatch repair protein MutT [Vibrio vulnificus]HDY8124440.1 NUDIX domain-containing protein [Vibrio vulnificus]HDZ3273175.1 NUDIX domain-containing protein [Vibrio vulnificus]
MYKRSFFVVISLIISLVFSTFSFAASSTSLPEGLKGALCIVRADDKLVLVNEILTHQISLPGGTIIAGEDPAVTAQRETWEETGLVVTVDKVLGYNEQAVFYDCISDSSVVAFNFNNSLDGNELPVWFAPHYGVEIASAMLLSPLALEASQYRYPQQWPMVQQMFGQATDQAVAYVNDLVESAPSYHQVELGWLMQLQSFVASSPVLSALGLLLSYFAIYLTSPEILLVVMPLAMWRFGRDFTYQLFFAVVATSLLCLVAQQGFALPRPHVYWPVLEMTQSYGFGFPSLPIAVWACLSALILHRLAWLRSGRALRLTSLVISVVMLGKFYSGAAFIADMMIGGLLGGLVAWHIIRLDSKPNVNVAQLLGAKSVWIAMAVLAAVLTAMWPLPVFSAWLATLIVISLLVVFFKTSKVSLSQGHTLIIVVALLSFNLIITLAQGVIAYSGLYSFIVETLRYPLIALLFAVLTKRFNQQN